ncbi:hypothetical protein VTH82DRAFT_2085 [Thermothelomyces myriococcoides]
MSEDWVPPVPAGYGDANRAFLQAFMARGTLTFREGQKVLAAIRSAVEGGGEVAPESITMTEFENFVRTAREAVEPLDYDIRNMRDQIRGGERVWAFVNAHSDPVTQLGTTRSAEEVAYIKRLLDAIFYHHNTLRLEVMAVDEGMALQVSRPPQAAGTTSAANGGMAEEEEDGNNNNNDDRTGASLKGLKHSEVLSLLSSLVAEGWLEKSAAGFYSLTSRALMELWSWLVETYNDSEASGSSEWQRIKFCEACKEIVTHGQRCNEPDCIVRLHDFCGDAFWRTRGGDRKCPACGTPWQGNHFVGERAITTRSGFQRGPGRKRQRQSEAASVTHNDNDGE